MALWYRVSGFVLVKRGKETSHKRRDHQLHGSGCGTDRRLFVLGARHLGAASAGGLGFGNSLQSGGNFCIGSSACHHHSHHLAQRPSCQTAKEVSGEDHGSQRSANENHVGGFEKHEDIEATGRDLHYCSSLWQHSSQKFDISILLPSSEQCVCVCVCVKFLRGVRTACHVTTLELKEFDFKWMPVG